MKINVSKTGEIPELLTPAAVAGLLGVTTRTIATYKAKNMIAFVQIGRVVRYRKQDVLAFIESYMVEPLTMESWKD